MILFESNIQSVDERLVTTIISRLTQLFVDMDEYKQGLIDDSGNVLVKRGKKNGKHRLSRFSLLIINLKKMIKRSIPDSNIRPVALSLLLLKEHVERLSEQTIQHLAESMKSDMMIDKYLFESDAPVNVSNASPQPQPTSDNIQFPEPPAVKKKKKMVGYKVKEISEWSDMDKYPDGITLYIIGSDSVLKV